jgi:hypothetical protein
VNLKNELIYGLLNMPASFKCGLVDGTDVLEWKFRFEQCVELGHQARQALGSAPVIGPS